MQENPAGRNMPVYAALSTMRQEPSQEEMNNGVIPLDTLPATWWNWMWNAITQAQNDSVYNDDVLFTEINNVLAAAGITPGTSQQHDQLRQAIMVIKDPIATTAAGGSLLSTDGGTTGTVKVGADGKMTVNNFGDIALFHGASKSNLMDAVNETYDMAFSNKDNAGELATLTTASKTTLVDAINELDAGKAPKAHASTETTYGIGSATNYGHVKLTDTPSTDDATAGVAATPKLVQDMVNGGLGVVPAVMFTYVVDSNQKLSDWLNNVTAGGQDYTSVLIRKGTWSYTHNSTTSAINTTTYTDIIWGEAGSSIIISTGNDNNTPMPDTSMEFSNLYHVLLVFRFRAQYASVYLNWIQDSLITTYGSSTLNIRKMWRTSIYAYPYRHSNEPDNQAQLINIGSGHELYECDIIGYGYLTVNPPDQPDEFWGMGGLLRIRNITTIIGCNVYSYYRSGSLPELTDAVFDSCFNMHRNICTVVSIDGGAVLYPYSTQSFASRTSNSAYRASPTPEGGWNI